MQSAIADVSGCQRQVFEHIEFRLKTYAIDENITSIGIGFED
ncbi:hypothetical protein Blolo01_20920 [Bifidobacterium longum subsp. longum]|nr:hypothetical protein Blolo01_20920 [Bifidobacterium longum subsp. longum]